MENRGRLGQQIILRESVHPSSSQRDEALRQAIGLLSYATDSNRAFWDEILKAYRLLVETPEEQLKAAIAASFSNFNTDRPPFHCMESTLHQYSSAAALAVEEKKTRRIHPPYLQFRKQQRPKIEALYREAASLKVS